jgi:hypothetical protein
VRTRVGGEAARPGAAFDSHPGCQSQSPSLPSRADSTSDVGVGLVAVIGHYHLVISRISQPSHFTSISPTFDCVAKVMKRR